MLSSPLKKYILLVVVYCIIYWFWRLTNSRHISSVTFRFDVARDFEGGLNWFENYSQQKWTFYYIQRPLDNRLHLSPTIRVRNQNRHLAITKTRMQRWPPATFLLALRHIWTNENIRTKGHFVGHRDIFGHLDTIVIRQILLVRLFCLWVILHQNISKPSMVYA